MGGQVCQSRRAVAGLVEGKAGFAHRFLVSSCIKSKPVRDREQVAQRTCMSTACNLLRRSARFKPPHTKMPFSLDKAVAGKRDAETLSTQSNKVPKLSEMVVTPPRQQTARITTNAPVNVVVYKARRKQSEATNFVLFLKPFEVTDNAGDLWSSYREGPPSKLWQIQATVQKLIFK